MSEKGSRKDKNQNIQVFVRLRPLNQRERDIKSLGVVEVANNREVVIRQSQQTSLTKKFTFDRAFGPNTQQLEVYQHVVSPLIEEVLAGYNCTVFAYGQTGTGKTHTMVGQSTGDENVNWQSDPAAGIIPRALSQLFDELRISNTEYTVRVSYLELYNEELFDLLSTSEDNSKLRIYEDVTRKGSNIVNGLEEIAVYNKNEVYKIMAQGQERKKIASTLMNAQSSRSHTVFTIVVHMKENSNEGEELVKIGKLNLVDLAGSENISKAGSDNPAKKERARECVNINQSLLTLGRVITALVERHPHIPYRESKLTRILQESLGGRTKTSIIATISPGHKDLEETMSTLEYAHRAKNIQNKPEINQKMTKKAMLNEYAEEIDKLKRELYVAREKNGVYLPNETFTEMTLKQEEQKKEIQELLLKKRAMEEERDRMEGVFNELSLQLERRDNELVDERKKLNSTEIKLANTSTMLQSSQQRVAEQRYLVEKHLSTEKQLSAQAQQILSVADLAVSHVTSLHNSVDKRRTVEASNLEVTRTYRSQATHTRNITASGAIDHMNALLEALNRLHKIIGDFTASSSHAQEESIQKLQQLSRRIIDNVNEITCLVSESQSSLTDSGVAHAQAVESAINAHSTTVERLLRELLARLSDCLQVAKNVDVRGVVGNYVDQWRCGMAARLSSLARWQVNLREHACSAATARVASSQRQRDCRRATSTKKTDALLASIQEIRNEKDRVNQVFEKQLADLETERQVTVQRLMSFIDNEMNILEENVARRKVEIDRERALLDQMVDQRIERHQEQLRLIQEAESLDEQHLQESKTEFEQGLEVMRKYEKEFEEERSAISVDIEVFSSSVLDVVEHVTGELTQAMQLAKDNTEREVATALETDKQTSKQFVENTNSMVSDIVNTGKKIMEAVVNRVQEVNSTTVSQLSEVASTTSKVISTANDMVENHSREVNRAKTDMEQFSQQLQEGLQNWKQLEEQYLDSNYTVYSPTGSTPVRTSYRYPRSLAATSPHERILARFRRENSQDDDCIVVESDQEMQSDPESSVSEDAVFRTPNPPVATTPAIFKSTSESDIYAIQKQQETQGKENTNKSFGKRPSKLPAPTSLKKPLVERNGI